MLIKIQNTRYNKDHIVSYIPDGESSITVCSSDGNYRGFGFSSKEKRDAALQELDEAMSQTGFYEIQKA